jgi:predicted transcriptional regulator
LIARKMLKERGLTQVRVAAVLHVSQASVSQYLNARRGEKLMTKLANDPDVDKFLDRLVDDLLDENTSDEHKEGLMCDLCALVFKKHLDCALTSGERSDSTGQ